MGKAAIMAADRCLDVNPTAFCLHHVGERRTAAEVIEAIAFVGNDQIIGAAGFQQIRNVVQVADQVRLMLDRVRAKHRREPSIDGSEISGRRDEVDKRASRRREMRHRPRSLLESGLVENIKIRNAGAEKLRLIEGADFEGGARHAARKALAPERSPTSCRTDSI
jgi:hypothetical protein